MNKEDLQFLPDTRAAELHTLPVFTHAILWIVTAFLVIAIVWANFAMIDEVAHAEGRVIPSSQLQVVQNLEGGILASVPVERVMKSKKGK